MAGPSCRRLALTAWPGTTCSPRFSTACRPRPRRARPRAAGLAGHAAWPPSSLRAAQPGLRRRPGPVGPRRRAGPGTGLGAGLRGRRRGRLRGPVILRPAARRVRRPGPGHLRRRLPRCHRHLQRRDSRRSAHRTGRAPPGDHPALVARGTGPRGSRRDHLRSPPLDQVRDHGADTCGRRPDPVRHRADRHRPDRSCGTRTCALIPEPTPGRPPERRERGRLRRRPGPAGPRR